MYTSRVNNHTQYLMSEMLRFFLEYKLSNDRVYYYKVEEFRDELKKVIIEVKRLFNIMIDEELEKLEAEAIETKDFSDLFKANNNINE